MKKSNAFLYYVVSIIALTGFFSNYNISNTGAIIPYLQAQFHLDEYYVGAVMSLPGIFSLIGAFVSGMMADSIGRKKTLLVATFFLIIMPILLAFSTSGMQYLVYRFLISLPIAMVTVVAPMFLAEFAPAEKRGSIVTGYQLSVVVSILMAYVVNYMLTDLNDNWRYMSAVAAIPAFIIFFLLFTIPESPQWKLSAGKGKSEDETISYKKIFQTPYRRMLIIGAVLMAVQQLTGTIQIFAFSNYIFMASGLEIKESIYQSISIGAVNLIFTIISMTFINRFKRKTLLVAALSFNVFSVLAIALYFLLHLTNGMILLLAALISIATFAMTIGPVPWTVLSEISPAKVRAKAMSFYIVALNIIGMLNCFTFPVLQGRLGTGFLFLVYTVFCLLAILFVVRFLPETKGKTLEELDNIWETS